MYLLGKECGIALLSFAQHSLLFNPKNGGIFAQLMAEGVRTFFDHMNHHMVTVESINIINSFPAIIVIIISVVYSHNTQQLIRGTVFIYCTVCMFVHFDSVDDS